MANRINRKYKDRVFRLVFREKKELLELYNAVNNSNYTDPEELEITTIEDALYMGMKNDLSFIIGDEMNLYEHQSTFSPNLSLRGLFYFASLYRAYIEPVKNKLYMDSKLMIPYPQYIVFYNGTQEEPERQELRLSDLFIRNGKDNVPALECMAVVLNINFGHNKALMEKCRTLKEYAQFIEMIRGYVSEGMRLEDAVEKVVNECIKQGILSDILRKNRAEVIDMFLDEYDEEEFRRFLRDESIREGREAGLTEGRAESYVTIIRQKLKKGLLTTGIAEFLEVDTEYVEMIARLIKENPEDLDIAIARKSLELNVPMHTP